MTAIPEIPDEAVEAYDGAYALAAVSEARGLHGWPREVAQIRAGLAAAYPILAAQAFRDAATAARSCRTCGKVHELRTVSPPNALFVKQSWADPGDGHAYRRSGPRHPDEVAPWLERRAQEVSR